MDEHLRFRIGIDLGGTKIEIAALGPDGAEVLRHRIPTPPAMTDAVRAIADAGARRPKRQLGGTATRRHRHPRRDQPGDRPGEERQLHRAERPRLRPRPRRSAGPRGAGRERRQLLRPVARRRTAPGAGQRWCSASSSAPAAAAASWWTGGSIAGRNRIAGEWGHNPLPWADGGELPGRTAGAARDCLETWSPARRSRRTATGRTRATPAACRRAPPPASGARRRRWTGTPTGWRGAWRRWSTCWTPTPSCSAAGCPTWTTYTAKCRALDGALRVQRRRPPRRSCATSTATFSGVRGAAWLWPPDG